MNVWPGGSGGEGAGEQVRRKASEHGGRAGGKGREGIREARKGRERGGNSLSPAVRRQKAAP